ncbi:hypothetical protein [Cupriavidus sp. DB3]|nr:hypothetical protein [Cupriavidus sp. DB3]
MLAPKVRVPIDYLAMHLGTQQEGPAVVAAKPRRKAANQPASR